ncbi:hypothetical protein ACSXBB_15210 [Clostridium perfringens]
MNKKELLASLIEEMEKKSRDELIKELDEFEVSYTLECTEIVDFKMSLTKIEYDELVSFISFDKVNRNEIFHNIYSGSVERVESESLISAPLYKEIHEFNKFWGEVA